jgi:hypothetical protein
MFNLTASYYIRGEIRKMLFLLTHPSPENYLRLNIRGRYSSKSSSISAQYVAQPKKIV